MTLQPEVQAELARRTGVYAIYKWLTALYTSGHTCIEDWNSTACERLFTANRLYPDLDLMTSREMRMCIPMSLSERECRKATHWDAPEFAVVQADLDETRRRSKQIMSIKQTV